MDKDLKSKDHCVRKSGGPSRFIITLICIAVIAIASGVGLGFAYHTTLADVLVVVGVVIIFIPPTFECFHY
jgi:hypothetical protein